MKGTTTIQFCRTLIDLFMVLYLSACLMAPDDWATHAHDMQAHCSGAVDDAPALVDRPRDSTGG